MGRVLLHLITGIFILCSFSCKKTDQQPIQKQKPKDLSMMLRGITRDVGSNAGGYFVALPGEYDNNINKYPTILYMHGAGHFGNGAVDLPNLLSEGIPALLDTKKFPGEINSGNEKFSFIVLLPQFKSYPSSSDLKTFLEFAKLNYRIDLSRIYLNGMSIGGRIACDFAADHPTDIAAIVPMAGASNFDVAQKCKKIAAGNLAVWAFHNEEDQVISVTETRNFISSLNAFNPPILPKLTIFPASPALLKHDAWTKPTDPEYKENGINIYEWMLQFKK